VFYVHANPVRAGMVKDARDYHWSTHRLYAFGKREPWMVNVVLPNWYVKLGKNEEQRQEMYRKLFDRYLKERGLISQRFLKKRFFGSILWIEQREALVRAWRKEHKAPP
jgi:putative transposase